MSDTLRNQNGCYNCGYTWYPRGKARSLRCPDCGSRETYMIAPSVEESSNSGCLWTAGILGSCLVVLAFWRWFLTIGCIGGAGYAIFLFHTKRVEGQLKQREQAAVSAYFEDQRSGHKTYDI